MDSSIELTLEQEFTLRRFSDLVQQMSREQAQDFLIDQYKLMMIQQTLYRELLQQEWKFELDTFLAE
ncbi:NblA/ycf18 family protein [Altericista sp. CCNU0014]|uniref:NblA/ycf18 family protein n=1 Tax=Altericista sp. CCNU0014 TaxID=3082949 RepID=UPI00384F49A9